jgi:hypothetical protein
MRRPKASLGKAPARCKRTLKLNERDENLVGASQKMLPPDREKRKFSSSGDLLRQCSRKQSSQSVLRRRSDASQAAMVLEREACCGRTFEAMKTSSRRPSTASPTMVSATPKPYISAVSMCVMPRSRPWRKVATTFAWSFFSINHVPWPITGTSRFNEPNKRHSIAGIHLPVH